MAYFRLVADDGSKYGSIEVFHHEGGYDLMPEPDDSNLDIPPMKPGWYWWACFPGCLPDGEPFGPFDSEEKAKQNAIDTNRG